MKIFVRAVGKMRDRRLEALCDEYLERTRRHLPVDVAEVDDDAGLLGKLPPGTDIIALEPGGETWTTQAFTDFLAGRMLHGTKGVAFLIGGAEGLEAATVKKAHKRLSLSALTLPHRLARVLLCEQIYRALSKIRGEPYDK